MTRQPETDLLSRLAEAIAAEADKPRAERVGLAHVMIAVVQPDLDERDAEISRLTAELQQTRQQLAAGPTPGIQYPSMGDAMGAAMAHNARMAANLHHNRPAPPGG